MADEPELGRGSGGEWVEYLQQLLEQAGHSPGAIDGDFGPRTEEAVRAFQAERGLTTDGAVGPNTWAALTGESGGAEAGGGDVPRELVEAGAPPSLSQWTDEQRRGYFEGEEGEDFGGDAPEEIEVAAIAADGEEGSWA